MDDIFTSTDVGPIARVLMQEYLRELPRDTTQDEAVILALDEARVKIWPPPPAENGHNGNGHVARVQTVKPMEFRAFADDAVTPEAMIEALPDDASRARFIEGLAKLGHLHQAAQMQAYANSLDEVTAQGEALPGSAERFVRETSSVEGAQRALAQSKVILSLTAHPTYNTSQPFMQAQRALALALQPGGDREGVSEAMRQFVNADLIPLDEKGHVRNHRVQDETQIMLRAFENLYHTLPALRHRFDAALSAMAQETGETYDSASLQLPFALHDWGSSGDKDGNQNVNATTTYYAAFARTARMMELLAQDVEALQEKHALKDSLAGDELAKWQRSFAREAQALTIAAQAFDGKRAVFADLDSDALAARLQALPDIREFQNDVKAFHAVLEDKASSSARDALLDLYCKCEVFGPHLGKIEYRETSEEFTRIVGHVLERQPEPVRVPTADGEIPYAQANDAQRSALLTRLIQDGRAPALLEAVQESIARDGRGREQTMLEATVVGVFRDSPSRHDGIDVKLPSGKVEFIARDVLEATFGSGATFEKGDAIHVDVTNINPAKQSYEQDAVIAYHTLKRLELARDCPDLVSAQILAECKGASSKLEVLFLMKGLEKDGKTPMLPITPLYESANELKQVAEIEGASYRNPAYREYLEQLADGGEPTQKVQIAWSDNTRRSGYAAAHGFIDDAHQKVTRSAAEQGVQVEFFEGGSNYDIFRGGRRDACLAIEQLGLHHYQTTHQGGDLEKFDYPRVSGRFAESLITACADQTRQGPRAATLADEFADRMLQSTLEHYQDTWFKQDTIGLVLASTGLGADTEMNASVGSRGQRRKVAFKQVEATVVGNVAAAEEGQEAGRITLIAIDPDKIRTINFSEMCQQAGVTPTWLGAGVLESNLPEVARDWRAATSQENVVPLDRGDEKFLGLVEGVAEDKPVTAKLLQATYARSASFRNTLDIIAQGVAMSDMNLLAELNPRLASTEVMHDLQREYLAAGKLALKTLGQPVPAALRSDDATMLEKAEILRQAVTRALPELADAIEEQRRHASVVNHLKAAARSLYDLQHSPVDAEAGEVRHTLGVLMHAACDTFMHNFTPIFADKAYREMKARQAMEVPSRDALAMR